MTEHFTQYGLESIEDDPRQVDVGISEWAPGKGDSILYTDGLDTCLGIAILDPYSHQGHLGHFADPLIEVDSIDEMLASAIQNTDARERLLVWIRGCADPVDNSGTPRTQQSKNLILRRLEALGLHNLDTEWGEDSGVCFSMNLDCAEGTCVIKKVEW